jgi:hypothetical protein
VTYYDEDTLQEYAAKRMFDACLKTVWWHTPNGGKRSKVTAAKLKKMGVRPGVADLVFFNKELRLAAEIKTLDGVQSKNQKSFQAAWEAQGGVYVIVRTPLEIDGLIFKFGLY